MAIRSSLYFIFDGITSEEMGLLNVNMSTGMQSEQYTANKYIREQKIRGNDRPYFQETQLDPRELTVSFAFADTWDMDKIRRVARWLTSPSYYKPLIFVEEEQDINKIYYATCIDSPELVHNCLQQGYINLKFRCMDAYVYTQVITQIYDFSSNTTNGTVFSFENLGDAECKPVIKIYKVGNGNVNFYNLSNGNAEFTLTSLLDGETVTVDCEAQTIDSDIPLTNRYPNLQGDFLYFTTYSTDQILVKGNCEVQLTYQFKRLQ